MIAERTSSSETCLNQIDPTQFTILVVDDNPTNLSVVVKYLESENYTMLVAQDGESALKRAAYAQPHLILLDVLMPHMDGFETCRRLKQDAKTCQIPVIFMTALSDSEDKVMGFSVGAVDYVTKPIYQAELLARIQVHLKLQEFTKILSEKNQLLVDSNQKLTAALEQVQYSQLKLIQQEKMSALGKLVAGVAHEINNPVNFIYGNLEHAEHYIQTILASLKLYQTCYPDPAPAIQEQADLVDLEFISRDLPKLMNSMKVGADRIQEIVGTLRTFSRMDEAEYKAVDIHAGIDSTLMILQHHLKPKPSHPGIQVIKEYGLLPLVRCYAGQLNQVFMNILNNAIDALEENTSQSLALNISETQPQITIRTSVIDSDWVKIAIADNGVGISPTIYPHIFEPFFTTKPVGKGTGLGMSISYQIITDRHGGTLECFSTLGQGTEFVIQLPVQQPDPVS